MFIFIFQELKNLLHDDRIVLTTIEQIPKVKVAGDVVIDMREENEKW